MTTNKEIQEAKDLFESILCIVVEGVEVMSHVSLLSGIERAAVEGYNLCKHALSNTE